MVIATMSNERGNEKMNKQEHNKYFNLVLEGIFLRDYLNKGTFRANKELLIARDYINNLDTPLTSVNYTGIMQKTIDFIDCTVIS